MQAMVDYQPETFAGQRLLHSSAIRLGEMSLHPLLSQRGIQAMFADRRSGCVWLAFGRLAALTAAGRGRFSSIRDQASRLFAASDAADLAPEIRPRFFGGFSFTDAPTGGVWSGFAPAQFHLPELFVAIQPDGISAAAYSFQSRRDADSRLNRFVDSLGQHHNLIAPANSACSVRSLMTQSEWARMVGAALDRIQDGRLQKVVLSRAVEAEFHVPISAPTVLAHLNDRYPDTTVFAFRDARGGMFLGASPELLVEKRAHLAFTAALAGSRRRGRDASEDQSLACELLQSTKERQEHQLVVNALVDRLGPWSSRLDMPAVPEVRRLEHIQHLYTPIRASLSDDTHVLDLVERLHPTPALGGFPRATALETIAELEPVSRGWYASPVGWFDGDGDGSFAVAIRSVLVAGSLAHLYAGAGIVSGSLPDAEWFETELKLQPMKAALGLT